MRDTIWVYLYGLRHIDIHIHLRPIWHRGAGLDSTNSDKLGWVGGVAIGYIT